MAHQPSLRDWAPILSSYPGLKSRAKFKASLRDLGAWIQLESLVRWTKSTLQGQQRVGSRRPIGMPLKAQAAWLFLLAIPVASIAWTVTHEELFREPREYCRRRSHEAVHPASRKFFFLFTCEFCFSHYVAAGFIALTRFHLLLDDWRGYVIALFGLVWMANIYMGLYAHIKLEERKTRAEAKTKEVEAEEKESRRPAA